MESIVKKEIIKSNNSIWTQENFVKIAKKGLYEVYFLIFYNKDRKESYWIRYTLLCKKNNNPNTNGLSLKESGEGLLWFGYFNSLDTGKNFIVKKHYLLSEVKGTFANKDDFVFITIGKSKITLNTIGGGFTTKSDREFSWNLKLSSFQSPNNIVPNLAKTLKITCK